MSQLHSWPEAIFHCDADAFYVGCEVARHPELVGKPVVVTGKLGGIVLAKSYDLKAKGVNTGAPSWELKKQYPDITILPADFEYYNAMSAKMFRVFQRWTPDVEVYSVDEAFLDMKGFRRLYKMDYEKMAYAIKEEVKKEVGISISIGVSVSKTLAKMAAEVNKPDGVTVISRRRIAEWLPRFHVSKVPGFGRNTVPLLEKHGIQTCADFANLTADSVKSFLHRPGLELWKELRGEMVHKVQKSWAPNKVITRTSSFSPHTADQRFLWSHTLRQLERALEALHDDHQQAAEVSLYLRDKNFVRYGWTHRFIRPSKNFQDFTEALKKLWRENFPRGKVMRSTGVILTMLKPDGSSQFTLFEDPGRLIRKDELETAKHAIKDRYGNHAIRSASSLRLSVLGPVRRKEMKARAFNVEW